MRQWRVGTFSMGLLLLCTGIGMLYAQFQPAPVAASLLTYWPAIFIILGIEVLLQSYFSKDDKSKIKYDIFSIFIIFIIVMSGMGLQIASQVGLKELIKQNVSAEHYYLQSNREIVIDKNIQKVIIEADGAPQLKIRSGTGDFLQCNIKAGIRAQSEAQGRQILNEKNQFDSRRDGTSLYLNLSSGAGNNCYDVAYSLILPERLAVEIEHRDASLQITAGRVTNDWLIRGDGFLDITLAPQSNIALYTIASELINLKGNLNWTTPEGKPLKMKLEEVDGTQAEYQTTVQGKQITVNSDQEILDQTTLQAQAKLGSGRYKMTIIHQGDEICVNQLP